ncbi:hypothetical protein T12_6068 [Trichinella patagoniensis]|uniref:Uncharacterized protein n=1 Tax=Trichinella patagoniensis TaxID=990121 RepID=A0A0V0YTG2_9BILA|nr:hypothetical protein T12_6068 [Trichinella patagoniensis]
MEISVLYICLVLKRLYRIAEKFLWKQSVDQHGYEEVVTDVTARFR